MSNPRRLSMSAVGLLAITTLANAQEAEPTVKALAVPEDPAQNAVLIGRVNTGDMVFQLELEGAESMWVPIGQMPMGQMTPVAQPLVWAEQAPAADQRYHVEFKLTDPVSTTRIPYAQVTFAAVNQDNSREFSLVLPPMWGSSGLHYSENGALAGDGAYTATVTVGVPTFMREIQDKDLWSQPVSARFHFRLVDGKITEVSEPQD